MGLVSFKTASKEVHRTGFEAASSRWLALLPGKRCRHVPAIRDTQALLGRLSEDGRWNLDEDGMFDIDLCEILISLLSNPKGRTIHLPLLLLAEEEEEMIEEMHPLSMELRTIDRFRFLAELLGLAEIHEESFHIVPAADEFLAMPPGRQLTAMLWAYLVELQWERCGDVPRGIPGSNAKQLQKEIPRRIKDLSRRMPDENGWINLSWYTEEGRAIVEAGGSWEPGLELPLAIEESLLLWEPFVWFGFLEPFIAIDPSGGQHLMEAKITGIGSKMLRDLAEHPLR